MLVADAIRSLDIELRSDNAAGAAPEIMSAIAAANTGSALAYGADGWTSELRDKVREVFDHPDAEVFPVISGTAANSLALSALCPPWGSILCHETAHIQQNECGATSLFGGGATIRGTPLPSASARWKWMSARPDRRRAAAIPEAYCHCRSHES